MGLLDLLDLNLWRDPRALYGKLDHVRERTNINNSNREEKRTPLNMCYTPFIGKQYAPKILFLPRSSEEKNRLKGITPKVPHFLFRNYTTPTDLSREEHF